MNKNYDYIIIGAGVAGIYSAIYLSEKYRVLLVEKEKLGGTSLRLGAVPVKKLLDGFKNHGDREEIILDFKQNWEKHLKDLDRIIGSKLENINIDRIYGDPEILNSKTIRLADTDYSSKKLIIATGTSPVGIPNMEIDSEYIVSHKDIVDKLLFEKDLVVYGGNVEGFEIANLLQLLGNKVTVIERENHILHGKDRDMIDLIEREFLRLGGKILTSTSVESTSIKDGKLYTRLSNGQVIISDKGVLTFSRKPNIPKGIENTKVEVDSFIRVDKNLRTRDKDIYAIGDVNGLHGMAHVAMDQAKIVADEILFNKKRNFDYTVVPGAYFTSPEYVGVGLCEYDLKTRNYKVGKAYLKDSFRGWSKSYNEGFAKVILDEEDRILGLHLVGDNVSEVLGFLSFFINRDARELLEVLVVHPSLSESIKEAMENAIRGELI